MEKALREQFEDAERKHILDVDGDRVFQLLDCESGKELGYECYYADDDIMVWKDLWGVVLHEFEPTR